MQITTELKTATGTEATALRVRTSRLISALKPETLRRLIQMGGDLAQRREFVVNATNGMAVDAVIEILKAAADASGQTISHSLIRMLSKLAAHAELGEARARPFADGALRDQVSSLLADWNLADPNPDAYGRMLEHLSTAAPGEQRSEAGGDQAQQSDPFRIVQMSLEIGGVGPLVDHAVARAIDGGAIGSATAAGAIGACRKRPDRGRDTEPAASAFHDAAPAQLPTDRPGYSRPFVSPALDREL